MGSVSLDLWILFWEPFSLSAGSAGGSISEEIFLGSWRIVSGRTFGVVVVVSACVRLLVRLSVAGRKGGATEKE